MSNDPKVATTSANVSSEERLSWLENPEVFRVNRLDAHSDHAFFGIEDDYHARKNTLIQSLNGNWKFAWSPCPAKRPENFFEEGFDDSSFGDILVPAHIELQGYDRIHYTNTIYPWEGHTFLRPPQIDWDYDPVGSYVCTFDVDEALRNKRICISFQGVEQALFVWLNGVFIGYSEDTFTPADFDLTEAIKDEGNRLCVEVYKRTSAAWIEDQDFFRFSGIFRDVFLYAKPDLHVEDIWAKASLRDDYATGTLSLEVKLSVSESGTTVMLNRLPEGLTTRLVLKNLASRHHDKVLDEEVALRFENGVFVTEEFELPEVEVWNHQHPALYELTLCLMGADGLFKTAAVVKIGFRRFEMIDKVMCLNGERLVIEGVNRHEWSAETGRVITEAEMRQDMEIFARNNISAVRTCHYPDQSLWYELCDEAGIYVMDETNLESHGSWQKLGKPEPSWNVPGNLPEWEACVVDRATSMLERDKNHPSILWWSCGNESFAGTCILAMAEFFRRRDPSRIVHYEGVYWNRDYNDISDVESRMYATPWDIREYLENDPQKPFVNCEYMHDMGNSLGGMESYVELAEEFPMYQGGFIWDYIDQALYTTDALGRRVLGYGGDFSDRPSDYNFSGNGLVFADRTEKPAMAESRFWHQPKRVRDEFLAKKDAWYAEETAKAAETAKLVTGKELYVTEDDGQVGVRGENFAMMFGYAEGGPTSLIYDGCEWMFRAMRPALWRAATENDKGCGFPIKSACWLANDTFLRYTGFEKEIAPAHDQVKMTYHYATDTTPETAIHVSYTVDGEGSILVEAHFEGKPGLPELPCFGMRFLTDRPVDRISWLGLEGETYPDRKKGAKAGWFESPIIETPYLVPQENGLHTDTIAATLVRGGSVAQCAGGAGGGALANAPKKLHFAMVDKPFYFSALAHTPLELESAFHQEDLPASVRTCVSVYGAMRGVGGIDTWGSDVEEAYHVSAEEDIRFSFMIKRR